MHLRVSKGKFCEGGNLNNWGRALSGTESRIARIRQIAGQNCQKFRSEKRKIESNRNKVELQKIDSEDFHRDLTRNYVLQPGRARTTPIDETSPPPLTKTPFGNPWCKGKRLCSIEVLRTWESLRGSLGARSHKVSKKSRKRSPGLPAAGSQKSEKGLEKGLEKSPKTPFSGF